MFKLTGVSGIRRSQGSSLMHRVVSPMGHLRGAMPPHPRRPAFMPDTPQESGWDSADGGRVSEPGETKQGYTGSNIGA